jgi:glycosyltransferase involved in cell wall biosynthesis
MKNKLIIITALYNVEDWIELNFRSVISQDYDGQWEWYIVDDMSTDSTTERLKKLVEPYDNIHLIVNEEKGYCPYNLFKAINAANPKDEDVIITLDGDDWLYNKKVLSIVAAIYDEHNCWLTYGSYIDFPAMVPGTSNGTYTQDVIEEGKFRQVLWCGSHLRTFKYGLFKHIPQDYCLDDNGDWFTVTYDLMLMFPMMEMARDRIYKINQPLYVYNMANPLNDHSIHRQKQYDTELRFRKMPIFDRLEKF